MKLDKAYIMKFNKHQAKYSTKDALMMLGDDLAASFLAPVTKQDVKKFEADAELQGTDSALRNAIFNVATTMLKDIDAYNDKCPAKTKSKSAPPTKKAKLKSEKNTSGYKAWRN